MRSWETSLLRGPLVPLPLTCELRFEGPAVGDREEPGMEWCRMPEFRLSRSSSSGSDSPRSSRPDRFSHSSSCLASAAAWRCLGVEVMASRLSITSEGSGEWSWCSRASMVTAASMLPVRGVGVRREVTDDADSGGDHSGTADRLRFPLSRRDSRSRDGDILRFALKRIGLRSEVDESVPVEWSSCV